jgi:hypothetical protein
MRAYVHWVADVACCAEVLSRIQARFDLSRGRFPLARSIRLMATGAKALIDACSRQLDLARVQRAHALKRRLLFATLTRPPCSSKKRARTVDPSRMVAVRHQAQKTMVRP